MRLSVVMLLSIVAFAGIAVADGPETGVLSGTVTASGQLMPGVTVSIEGDTGSKTAVTDGQGVYRFALLTPGSYKVTAGLDSFKTFEGNATVTPGGQARLDVELILETSESVYVTSEAPVINKFEVGTGSTIEAEVAEEVTSKNTSYYATLQIMPGVTGDGRRNGDDRPSVNGARWQEGGVFVDGVDTTFSRYGASRIFLPTVATSTVTLESGGSGAEYGRYSGGVTNVVTRSGTNTLRGDLSLHGQDEGVNADYKSHPELAERSICAVVSRDSCNPDFLKRSPEEDDVSSQTIQAAFGGPFVRDKAWYFLSAANIDTGGTELTSTGDVIENGRKTDSYVAKLNFQPGANHSLALSWISTPQRDRFTLPNVADRYGPTRRRFEGELISGTWNYLASANLFFETKVAQQTNDENKFLNVGDGLSVESALAVKQQDPRYGSGVPSLGEHAPTNNFRPYFVVAEGTEQYNGWFLDNGFGLNQFPRDQFNFKTTWFAPHDHEVAIGLDYQEVAWDQRLQDINTYVAFSTFFDPFSPSGFTAADGSAGCGLVRGRICLYRDLTPADLEGTQQTDRGTISENTALYIRDRFTVGRHWGFNLGLRIENQKHENDLGRTVIDSDDIAPRLSGSYDIKGNGRQQITLSVGRTYQQFGQDLTNNYLIEGWNGTNAFDRFTYCDSRDVAFRLRGCSGVGYNRISSSGRPGTFYQLVDAGRLGADIDIEAYYKDEVILGYEWNVAGTWYLDAKAIFAQAENYVGTTEQKLDNGNLFFLTENIVDYPDALRTLGYVSEDNIAHLEDPKREYKAIQLQFNRRQRNGWALYNNVTLQDSKGAVEGNIFFNTNDDYGRNLESVLEQQFNPDGSLPILIDPVTGEQSFTGGHIATCANDYTGPPPGGMSTLDFCMAALSPHLGVPLSTINRFGRSRTDHEITWKTFGYKNWTLGRHGLNLGGFFTWESGRPWQRTISLPIQQTDDNSFEQAAFDTTITVFLQERGAETANSLYTLDLFGSWDFPLGPKLTGQLRLEVNNATNQQEPRTFSNTGEVVTYRFGWQRPRRYQALVAFRF